jgi:hypothetical protein
MEPFARKIDAAKKYVVSSTLDRGDWNAELVRGDLGKAVQQLKRESGRGLFVGSVKLPLFFMPSAPRYALKWSGKGGPTRVRSYERESFPLETSKQTTLSTGANGE